MGTSAPHLFDDLAVDHVEFYVADLRTAADRLRDGYGFAPYAASRAAGASAQSRSIGAGRGEIRLLLTEALVEDHPAAAYVERHGDGVAGIALAVADADAAFAEAVRRGARPVAAPSREGGLVTSAVMGFGDLVHTFVQRAPGGDPRGLPGLVAAREQGGGWDAGLEAVDHFAVCVEAGQLDATVEFYERVLDFEMTFTERILVGRQAMNSKVVQSRSRAVTYTMLEPDTTMVPGQIDEFLKNHNGPGIQHIAFSARDIVAAVGAIAARGVQFLGTPDAYYARLVERLQVTRHDVEALRELAILVDQDQDGQLFQIFARSVHPRKTFFFEIIERLGARTFGAGNIKALYEAIELQRRKDGVAD